MTDLIHYNYGANYASLDDIQGAANDAQQMRQEVIQVFNALREVYDSESAEMLQQIQTQVLGQMDLVLTEIEQTRRGGNQSQEDADVLDKHLAGGFSF